MELALEELSPELVEMVVTRLPLKDIKSLRRTSRTMENKASHGHFAGFFITKNIKLTRPILQRMVYVTGRGGLGCRLQHCTIIGIDWMSRNTAEERGGHLHYLADAFSNLRRFSSRRGLLSLSLRVGTPYEVPKDERNWRGVWRTALFTFDVTMEALHKSQLMLYEHLDVFGSVKGCSLNCDTFQTFVRKFGTSTCVLRRLKKLTLSLSAPHHGIHSWSLERDIEEETQWSHSNATLRHISRLLQIAPELESLDVHWYRIGNVMPGLSPLFPTAHREETSDEPLIRLCLKECTIRGLHISGDDLLQFLKTISPNKMTLIFTQLHSEGTYDELFDYLISPDCPIAEYHLDDICKEGTLVHYENVPGSSKFPYGGAPMGPSTFTQLMGHDKIPIDYRFAPGDPPSSAAQEQWSLDKTREFGKHRQGRFVPSRLIAGRGLIRAPERYYIPNEGDEREEGEEDEEDEDIEDGEEDEESEENDVESEVCSPPHFSNTQFAGCFDPVTP